jgi:hypothetical protein
VEFRGLDVKLQTEFEFYLKSGTGIDRILNNHKELFVRISGFLGILNYFYIENLVDSVQGS